MIFNQGDGYKLGANINVHGESVTLAISHAILVEDRGLMANNPPALLMEFVKDAV